MRRWAMFSILAIGLLTHGSAQQSTTPDSEVLPAQGQRQNAPAVDAPPAMPAQTDAAPASIDSGAEPQASAPVSSDPQPYESPQADSSTPSAETSVPVATPAVSTSTAGSAAGLSVFMIFCIAVLFVFYWLPAMNGFRRKHRNAVPILLVNFFFGWTFIGWVVALIWSASDNTPVAA